MAIYDYIGYIPSLSAIKPDNQAFVVYTPNFTSKSCEVGGFYIFLTVQAGQKRNGFNISNIARLPITPAPPYYFAQPYIYIDLGLVGHICSPN